MGESRGSWVTVRAFTSVTEAQFAGSALEAAGLDVRLGDQHLIAMQWMYSNAVGGVKVQVPADQVDEARQILDVPAEVDDPRAIVDPSEACPTCGSLDVESGVAGRQPAMWMLLITGVPLFPRRVRRQRRCKGCGGALNAPLDR